MATVERLNEVSPQLRAAKRRAERITSYLENPRTNEIAAACFRLKCPFTPDETLEHAIFTEETNLPGFDDPNQLPEDELSMVTLKLVTVAKHIVAVKRTIDVVNKIPGTAALNRAMGITVPDEACVVQYWAESRVLINQLGQAGLA